MTVNFCGFNWENSWKWTNLWRLSLALATKRTANEEQVQRLIKNGQEDKEVKKNINIVQFRAVVCIFANSYFFPVKAVYFPEISLIALCALGL